jgi:predicted enzyme related to lactoylglutathione lyase
MSGGWRCAPPTRRWSWTSARGRGRPPRHPSLPTSNVFFYAEDLQQTHQELTARGVEFPLPPVQQPFGWWSLFQDPDGNRFALVPRRQ